MKVPDFLSEKTKLSLHKLPTFIKNWLVIALLLLTGSLVGLGFLVKFPEKISGKVSFKNITPDIPIVSKAEGRLHLMVHNKDKVKEGQILGYIETSADIGDILWLDSLLNPYNPESTSLPKLIPEIHLVRKTQLNLGILQATYERLIKRLKDLKYLSREDNILQKIKNLRNQKEKIAAKISSLKAQQNLVREELELAKKNFETDKKLHQQQVISDYDFNKRQKDLLDSKKELQAINFSLAENQELIEKTNYQILDLESIHNRGLFDLEQQIMSDLALLGTEIMEWKENNVFYTNKEGTVNFALDTEEEKFVNKDDPVFYIIPGKQDQIVGNLKVPSAQIGEIVPGQKIVVKLDGYPYEKYGVLFAQVDLVNDKQEGNQLLIEMNMGSTLQSSSGYEFKFIQDMTGIGEVIIAEESLAQKILKIINQFKFQ